MKNMMKMVALVLLFSFVTGARAEEGWIASVMGYAGHLWNSQDRRTKSWVVINNLNGMHRNAPYFPGSWPLHSAPSIKSTNDTLSSLHKKLKRFGFKLRNFELPDILYERNDAGAKKRTIDPSIQLGLAATKCVFAVLIVRGVYKKLTKKHDRKN